MVPALNAIAVAAAVVGAIVVVLFFLGPPRE
jgi:ABC-type transporter Mla maintaining outer membrane lipid asymmetry permease subunit MlaE